MTTKTAVKEKKDATTNSKEMFINKVKINNDNTASIYYRTTCDSNAQEVYYQGKEEVTEDFKAAFQNTVIGLTNLLPRLAPDSHKIQMNAIKFEYDKTEFLKSALYSAKYQFSDQTNAVINLNTPRRSRFIKKVWKIHSVFPAKMKKICMRLLQRQKLISTAIQE